jgi:hypothetical protein
VTSDCTRIGRTWPLAKKALTAALPLYLVARSAGVSPSCGAGTQRAGGARVDSGERDGEVRTTMVQQTCRAIAPPLMALAIWVIVAVSGPGAL